MEEQLEKGKILPLLLKLAIPSTAAQIVNALYSICLLYTSVSRDKAKVKR